MSGSDEYSFSQTPIGEENEMLGSGVDGGMEASTKYIIIGLVVVLIVLIFIYMRSGDSKKEGMIDPLLPLQVGRGFNVPNDMGYAGPVSEIAALEKSRTTSFGPVTF